MKYKLTYDIIIIIESTQVWLKGKLYMSVENEIREFLLGNIDIITFQQKYDSNDDINDFLQNIVDSRITTGEGFIPTPRFFRNEITFSHHYLYCFAQPELYPGYVYGNDSFISVRNFLTKEWRMLTHNVRTASGAWRFYDGVFDIFYQYDSTLEYRGQKYEEAYCYMLEVIPDYLSGGQSEMYIQEHIIPLFPETMPKTRRIKEIKARIRQEFKSEKGYPSWVQSSDWPIGTDGKPMTYVKKGKRIGNKHSWIFRDESTGELTTVEQYE